MKLFPGAIELISSSQNILVLSPKDTQGDSLGCALALFDYLKKIGKNVNLKLGEIPEKFRFLQSSDFDSGDFVISVDTSKVDIEKIRYEKGGNDLKIIITPKTGLLQERHVSFASLPQKGLSGSAPLDYSLQPNLLITVGAKSLDDLGEIFEQNPEIFYETPILNIDNDPSNENYGEINMIEITSCSLAEIVSAFIKSVDESAIDGNVATFLLTGLITASQNFQNPKTTPKTFEIASYLIERGANHQKIIQHLYKTNSAPQIKLLGKVLEKLNFDEKKEIVWSSLTAQDFQTTEADSRDLSFVVEELKTNFWKLPSLLVLWESHASGQLVKGVFYSSKPNFVEKILENFEGVSRGEGVLFLIRENDLKAAEEKILNILC